MGEVAAAVRFDLVADAIEHAVDLGLGVTQQRERDLAALVQVLEIALQ